MVELAGRIFQHRRNILIFKIWVILKDFHNLALTSGLGEWVAQAVLFGGGLEMRRAGPLDWLGLPPPV